MIILLSQSEVEELDEHFTTTPAVWRQSGNVWMRIHQRGERAALAVGCAVNPALPPPYNHELHIKGFVWTQKHSEEYMLWVLRRFTRYDQREYLTEFLTPLLKDEYVSELHTIVGSILGSCDTRLPHRSHDIPSVEDSAATRTVSADVTPTQTVWGREVPMRVVPAVAASRGPSRYLKNLIAKGKGT